MNDKEMDDLLDLAKQVATSAGEVIMKTDVTERRVASTKSSQVDIVTASDHASEEHIVSTLSSLRPQDSILGEEGASISGTSNVKWVVDPIDGTVNFLYGIPSFAVSIGAEIDGKPAIGAVFNPTTDELFWARSGSGAFLNNERITVRPAPPLSRALVATGFDYESERRARQAAVVGRLLPAVRDIRRIGSASLDMCAVASGRVDAYYEEGIKPWDICAGTVIAIEAGARVSTLAGKPISSPGPDEPISGSVVACHPALMSDLRRLVS